MATNPKKRAGGRPKRNADELLAVAIATGMPVQEAAEKCNLSAGTVYSRMKEPAFRARVAELRSEIASRAVGYMASLLEEAGERLRKLLRSRNEVVALGAVREVHHAFGRLRADVDFAERMTRMEEALGLVPGAQPGKEEKAEDEKPEEESAP